MLRISEVTLIGMAGVMAVSLSLRQDIPVCSAGVNAPHAASFCAWVDPTFSNTCAHASLKGGAVKAGTGHPGTLIVPVTGLLVQLVHVAVMVWMPPATGAVNTKFNLPY